jgi:hypothetical protein
MWQKRYEADGIGETGRMSTHFSFPIILMFVLMGFLFVPSAQAAKPGTCTKVAENARAASKNEIRDEYWIAVGKCNNLADSGIRKNCRDLAREELQEAKSLSRQQFKARKSLCASIGEQPYDLVFDPLDFVDFAAVLGSTETFNANQYFPLIPGTVWLYSVTDGNDVPIEEIRVEVLEEYKEILGINCIVVRDQVWEIDPLGGDPVLVEDTYDWYAQDLDGVVWYFGEIASNYEDGELIDTEGSWKGGRDYAVPGIVMLANPQAGDVYRQEFLLGDAEDAADVIGYVDGVVVGATTYDNVLKTHDFTPIEPDVLEYKYYAPGIGFIYEEKLADDPADEKYVRLDQFIPVP